MYSAGPYVSHQFGKSPADRSRKLPGGYVDSDLGYNPSEKFDHLEKQVRGIKSLHDQDDRLDAMQNILSQMKEDTESRGGRMS